jgi:hypothetical protein
MFGDNLPGYGLRPVQIPQRFIPRLLVRDGERLDLPDDAHQPLPRPMKMPIASKIVPQIVKETHGRKRYNP